MKKLISLIVGIAALTTLTSCSNDNGASSTESKKSSSTSISTSASTDNIYAPFIVNDDSIYPSSFIINENSLIFTNWEDNNKISILNEPFPKSIISSTNVTNFFEYSATSLVNVNNTLYFGDTSNSSNLASLNLTDKTYTKLNNRHVHDITALNNEKIVYLDIPETDSNKRKLYVYDIENKKDSLVTSDNVGRYVINNNFIIYQNLSDGSKLYKISPDGRGKEKLTNYSVESIAIFGSQIFVSNSDDDNNLYKLDPSSLESNRFAIFNIKDLKVFNNQVYGINKSNNLCRLNISIESNELKTELLTSDSINEYYPTEKGIFLQKGLNVNNAYLINVNNK